MAEQKSRIVVATRKSPLALRQAGWVQNRLAIAGYHAELLGITTAGDRAAQWSVASPAGKSLFVKDIEIALESGAADLAVHSLKDVPMALPEGFHVAAIPQRENPHDAFVSNNYADLAALPANARVGTSSLRRTYQLKAIRPDIQIAPLRGNVDSRLQQLDSGRFDAIIVAAAGLIRLGLEERITTCLDADVMVPAPGQGALALEIRRSRTDLARLLARHLSDPIATLTTEAERTVARLMDGGCSTPLGAFATYTDGMLALRAVWGDQHDPAAVLVKASAEVSSPLDGFDVAEELGREVAASLIMNGAKTLAAQV